jgi:DNA repair exonuclease SbcCD ATPase subunit
MKQKAQLKVIKSKLISC